MDKIKHPKALKDLNAKQISLLQALKKMPIKKGILITCSSDIHDMIRVKKDDIKMAKTYIRHSLRRLASQGFIKKVEPCRVEGFQGQRLKITL